MCANLRFLPLQDIELATDEAGFEGRIILVSPFNHQSRQVSGLLFLLLEDRRHVDSKVAQSLSDLRVVPPVARGFGYFKKRLRLDQVEVCIDQLVGDFLELRFRYKSKWRLRGVIPFAGFVLDECKTDVDGDCLVGVLDFRELFTDLVFVLLELISETGPQGCVSTALVFDSCIRGKSGPRH